LLRAVCTLRGLACWCVYAFCGLFVFFILRVLGELMLQVPSSGSFVSYPRGFLGEKAAFVAGWMYFCNGAAASIVDVTAIALHMRHRGTFRILLQWSIALIAPAVVLTMNMISVKLYGELEFWAALIKVVTPITFLIVGTVVIADGFHIDRQPTGPSVIASNDGLFPIGVLELVIVTSGVVFAFAAVELVGNAAGETENPHTVVPRAINSVVLRIAVFYVGAVIRLGLLLPYSAYAEGASPFVSVFSTPHPRAPNGCCRRPWWLGGEAAIMSAIAGSGRRGRAVDGLADAGRGHLDQVRSDRHGR
jgi:L-asparagine permease